jgi:hypothetical protein
VIVGFCCVRPSTTLESPCFLVVFGSLVSSPVVALKIITVNDQIKCCLVMYEYYYSGGCTEESGGPMLSL